jgi:hypothetical protein
MKSLLRRLSLLFSAGALGGLVNSIVVGEYNQNLALPMVYSRVVWGGLWGFIFLIPLKIKNIYVRGLYLSFAPTLSTWLIVLPSKGKGLFGYKQGPWIFLTVIVFNAIWALVTAFWLKSVREE